MPDHLSYVCYIRFVTHTHTHTHIVVTALLSVIFSLSVKRARRCLVTIENLLFCSVTLVLTLLSHFSLQYTAKKLQYLHDTPAFPVLQKSMPYRNRIQIKVCLLGLSQSNLL